MKIITSVTVHYRAKEGADVEVLAPGEHDLPDADAKDLIKRGFAEHAAKVKAKEEAKAEANKGAVKVETKGNGPKVEQQ